MLTFFTEREGMLKSSGWVVVKVFNSVIVLRCTNLVGVGGELLR
jgi:hypothetical protein